MSPERFLWERKMVTPCIWTENRKGAGTNSEESGARNLEAESIRSRYSAILHKNPREKKPEAPYLVAIW